jgi:hypothetical protein
VVEWICYQEMHLLYPSRQVVLVLHHSWSFYRIVVLENYRHGHDLYPALSDKDRAEFRA